MRCPSWPASVPSGAKPEALTLCQSRPLIVVAGGPVRVTRHLPCGAGSVRLDRHFPVIEPQPASVAKRATRLNENGLPCPCLCPPSRACGTPRRQFGGTAAAQRQPQPDRRHHDPDGDRQPRCDEAVTPRSSLGYGRVDFDGGGVVVATVGRTSSEKGQPIGPFRCAPKPQPLPGMMLRIPLAMMR